MPIDLVIDDREGGSKSDSEDITRSANLTDQVCAFQFQHPWEKKKICMHIACRVTSTSFYYLHMIKSLLDTFPSK